MKPWIRRVVAVALPAAAGVAASPSRAQDAPAADAPPESDLEEAILVVARGYETSAPATAKVTRLGREDVERRQATHVHEVLSEVPGVQVLPDGPAGQFARIFVRGAASNQTLVLVDGVPQNDATAGGLFDWNDLSTSAVGRIEVLSGSYGVLYGSEAIGGVVALTTRRGEGPLSGFARFEGGSFDTHREVVGAGFGDEELDLAFTASNHHTHGERDRETYRGTDGTLRVGVRLAERLRLDTTLRAVDSAVESPFDFPLGTVLPEDDNIDRDRRTYSAGATLEFEAAEGLTARLSGSFLRVASGFENGSDGPETIDPDFTPGTGDEVTVVRDELETRNRVREVRARLWGTAEIARLAGWRRREDGGLALDVTGGGELLDEDSESRTTSPDFGAPTSSTTEIDRNLDTKSAFVQAEARFADGETFRGGALTAGVRGDDHDAFGSESSPFLGGRVTVSPTATTLRSVYGEGFRAPRPSELDDPFVGNADLGAETSESLDAGVLQELLGGDLRLGVTWFRLRTDDLIAYDAAAVTPDRPFGQLRNFRSTETTGLEWEVAADLGAGFTLRGTYTKLNPRDEDTGRPLPNRSRELASAGVSWERGDFLVSLDGTWATAYPEAAPVIVYPEGDERRHPGRRTLVNLTARWRVSDTLTVFARLENLLDDDWVATTTSPAGTPFGAFAGIQLDF